jgi:uncharacterized membrane protein YhaH (DUF805 family)
MSFGQAISTAFRKFAEFEGRATRSEFWWFALFATLVSLAVGSVWDDLAAAWFFVVLLPSLAVSVRRLRDAGYAWPMIFLGLIPLVGLIILIVLYSQPSISDRTTAADSAPQS